MFSPSANKNPAFITPIAREDLFDAGVVFPGEELTRRILSFFWRDCCCPACFSRAPAPVIQVATEAALEEAASSRGLRAWWLLEDGILEDPDGPDADRLQPFFERVGRFGQLWPRYEFRVVADGLELEMWVFREPRARQGQRVRLGQESDGQLRVIEQQPWVSP